MTATAPIARASGATARAATQAVQVVRAEAPGWFGGVAAGVQGALFSFALVLIPLWVIAAATSEAEVSWSAATGVASRVWLLGFGVPWAVDGTPVTLIPLGIPALTALMLVQLARRFSSATWTAGVMGVLAFAGSVAGIAALAWSDAPDTGSRVVRAAVLAAVIASPSIAWGLARQRGVTLAWLEAIPSAVRAGTRLALAMTGMVVAASAVIALGALLTHRYEVGASASALGPDTVSGVSLAFLETLYAPTVLAWIASWVTGAGYTLAGVHHVPGVAVETPLPVPLMGALPGGSGAAAWAPWIVVLAGFVAAYALRRRLGRGLTALAGIGAGAAAAAVALGLFARAAHGAMGPGSFAAAGPSAWLTGIMAGLELAAGAIAAGLLWHATSALYGTSTVRVRPQAGPRPATEPRPRSGQTPRRDTPRGTGESAAP